MVANNNQQPGKRPAARTAISAHPAFPAIVALWFAALLGLGSLVLPVALLEKMVGITGLGGIFASAQPPLGATARIIIAVTAAVAGALSGLLVARQVASAQAPAPAPRFRTANAPASGSTFVKKPISALEELGSEGLDQPVEREAYIAPQVAGRRRALNMTDESGPSEFLEKAPLPGEPSPYDEPLELTESDEDVAPVMAAQAFGTSGMGVAQGMMPDFASADIGPGAEDAPLALPRRFDAPQTEQPELAPEFAKQETPAAFPLAADELVARPLAELGMVQLVERFAISLQRHRPQADTVEPQAPEAASIEITDAIAEAGPDHAPPVPMVPAALRPINFEDLSDNFDDDDAFDDDYALPMIDLKAALASQEPMQQRRFEKPSEDTPAENTGGFAAQTADDIEPEEESGIDSYSSLLDMKRAIGNEREIVRIDEQGADEHEGDHGDPQPVVIFPGQEQRRATPASDGPSRDPHTAPQRPDFRQPATAGRKFEAPVAVPASDAPVQPRPDPAETERALRDALAKLQRMSGAA